MKKLFLLLVLSLFVGCASSGKQTDDAYNVLPKKGEPQIKPDGYVIGIEKRERESIGNPKDRYPKRFQLLKAPLPDKILKKRNEEFKKVTNDKKPMLVTHIAKNINEHRFLYNPYENNDTPELSYEKGYEALDLLQKDIVSQICKASRDGKPYSHLFIMSMGWNNDQKESIKRFNTIVHNIDLAAKLNGAKHFHPLTIGITWPSVWKSIAESWFQRVIVGHLGSYFNKSNDADELGYTILNWFFNKQLPEIKAKCILKENFPKVVAIGHSLGARILSRAIFSSPHLLEQEANNSGTGVDAYIGLQGAFSANRFIACEGNEGWPYAGFSNLKTKFILTASKHDKANPIARYITRAKHVGGKYGLKAARKEPALFETVEWPKNKANKAKLIDALNKAPGKVIMIDASEIVNNDNEEKLSAHNDILDLQMGQLILFIIQNI
nr:hypothetical protein [uncultured Desulfobacter sp.]